MRRCPSIFQDKSTNLNRSKGLNSQGRFCTDCYRIRWVPLNSKEIRIIRFSCGGFFQLKTELPSFVYTLAKIKGLRVENQRFTRRKHSTIAYQIAVIFSRRVGFTLKNIRKTPLLIPQTVTDKFASMDIQYISSYLYFAYSLSHFFNLTTDIELYPSMEREIAFRP